MEHGPPAELFKYASLEACMKIVGGQSDLVRESEENDFHAGISRVILLTLGAGSEALTLVEADTATVPARAAATRSSVTATSKNRRPNSS